MVFGITKFHQYLAGRTFTVMTDHKPLVGLFGGRTPQVTSPRILRWLMTLSAYSFEVCYRPGSQHGNADALSRLPVESVRTEPTPEPPIMYLNYLDANGERQSAQPPVTAEQIAQETDRDPVLAQVRTWAREGWPKRQPEGEAGDFWKKRSQISITRGCVLWGERVCVPAALRADALARLHSTHQGVMRSKSVARTIFWWPHLDEQIEQLVGTCQVCQLHRADPPKASY